MTELTVITNHVTARPQHVTSALLAARLAAQQKDTAHATYKRAILDACRAGATYTELANTIGVTRQAIRQLALTS